eukprot:scaffold88493_cov21-Tisochrysis_lutea.AAC.2
MKSDALEVFTRAFRPNMLAPPRPSFSRADQQGRLSCELRHSRCETLLQGSSARQAVSAYAAECLQAYIGGKQMNQVHHSAAIIHAAPTACAFIGPAACA